MTTIPDYIGALFTRVRRDSATFALCGERISGSMDKWVGMPTYGVLFLPTGGTDHLDVGHILPRVDVWCYGPGRREAMDLWRTIYGYLMGVDGSPSHFIEHGVLVQSMVLEGGPNYIPEPDSKYPRVVGSFRMRVATVLVS